MANIQNINNLNTNQPPQHQQQVRTLNQQQNSNNPSLQQNMNIQRPPSQSSPLVNSNQLISQQLNDPNAQQYDQFGNQQRFINGQQQQQQQAPNSNNPNAPNSQQQFNPQNSTGNSNQPIRQISNPQQAQQPQPHQLRQQMPQQQIGSATTPVANAQPQQGSTNNLGN